MAREQKVQRAVVKTELNLRPSDGIYVDKKALVTFIAGVINSTAEEKSKSSS